MTFDSKTTSNSGAAASRSAARIQITPEQLAAMGAPHVAYMRPIAGDAVKELFPDVEGIPADLPDDAQLFALYRADGMPVMLADTKSAVLANAEALDLTPVTVH